MTPNEIKTMLVDKADLLIAQYGGDTILDQNGLNVATNGVIEVVNTVNPTPPTYPPKGM